MARRATLDDDAWVTIDQALEVGGDRLPALSKNRRWQVVTPSMGRRRRGEESGEPPAELVAEKVIEVIYMDENDVRATYSGHVDRFDASLAERIVAIRWQTRTRAVLRLDQARGANPEKIIPAGARSSARSPGARTKAKRKRGKGSA